VQFDADRQLGLDGLRGRLQGLTHADDVVALGHRNDEPNHLADLVPHLHLRRINVGAPDLGDVT